MAINWYPDFKIARLVHQRKFVDSSLKTTRVREHQSQTTWGMCQEVLQNPKDFDAGVKYVPRLWNGLNQRLAMMYTPE